MKERKHNRSPSAEVQQLSGFDCLTPASCCLVLQTKEWLHRGQGHTLCPFPELILLLPGRGGVLWEPQLRVGWGEVLEFEHREGKRGRLGEQTRPVPDHTPPLACAGAGA